MNDRDSKRMSDRWMDDRRRVADRSRLAGVLAGWAATAVLVAACHGGRGPTGETVAPEPLESQECAACGMTVRNQPTPRGQVVHRDGAHAFFCSVADMVTYIDVPSPNGPVVAWYVEDMPADATPEDESKDARPWVDATSASYVVGFERPVMGTPTFSYSEPEAAARVASRLGARVVSWAELPDALQ